MQGLPQIIELSAAFIVLMLASVWDIRQRRIPNAVTFPAILLGLTLTGIFKLGSMPLTIAVLVLLFFFGTLNLMGQGDVKLIMALVAICGASVALISAGLAAIIIVGVQLLLYPKETVSDVKNALSALITTDFKRINKEGRTVPFAPYILTGFTILVVYQLLYL